MHSGGPKEAYVRWGSFLRGKGMPEDTAVRCAQTAKPIEMPFGLWTQVS